MCKNAHLDIEILDEDTTIYLDPDSNECVHRFERAMDRV